MSCIKCEDRRQKLNKTLKHWTLVKATLFFNKDSSQWFSVAGQTWRVINLIAEALDYGSEVMSKQ